MLRLLLTLICSFVVCVALMPLVIMLARKLKVRQTVLSYVDNHAAKSGTPTMGGLGFVIAAVVCSFAFYVKGSALAAMVGLLTLGFGLIGFIDDFIKVFYKQNKGLSPVQKTVFQVVVAIIVSFLVYYSPYLGDKLYIPFTIKEISFEVFSVPF